MFRRSLTTFLTVAALAAVSATANAGQFIMRARSAADADTLCARYQLVDVRDIHTGTTGDICIVATAAPQTPAQDDALRQQVSADPLTVSFELDRGTALAESTASTALSTTSSSLAQSTAAILESATGQVKLAYFGGLVPQGYVAQPAAGLMRVAGAQGLGATGAGIVAIVDTGIDPTHEALAGTLVPGYDFVNGVAGYPTDYAEIAQSTAAILEQLGGTTSTVALLNQSTAAILEQSTAAILEAAQLPPAFGHGTMVAGLVHLVAPTAMIMPLKAFRADGSANLSDLVNAVYFAADNGATVINMSFTLTTTSQALLDAISYAASKGVLCVAAAGNDGIQTNTYPSAWPNVLGVGSTTATDQRSLFSNWGSRVDMCAPGEALITAYPGNHYAQASGTSFSTALLSGAVAVLHEYVAQLSHDDAIKLLEEGAKAPSGLGKARLDLYMAIFSMLHN